MFSFVDNVAEYFLSPNFTKHFSFDREYKLSVGTSVGHQVDLSIQMVTRVWHSTA